MLKGTTSTSPIASATRSPKRTGSVRGRGRRSAVRSGLLAPKDLLPRAWPLACGWQDPRRREQVDDQLLLLARRARQPDLARAPDRARGRGGSSPAQQRGHDHDAQPEDQQVVLGTSATARCRPAGRPRGSAATSPCRRSHRGARRCVASTAVIAATSASGPSMIGPKPARVPLVSAGAAPVIADAPAGGWDGTYALLADGDPGVPNLSRDSSISQRCFRGLWSQP